MKKSKNRYDLEIESQLIESSKCLQAGEYGITLTNILKSKFPNSHYFYLLDSIPDQGVELFWVLTDPKTVAVVEILSDGKQISELVSYEEISLQKYIEKFDLPVIRKTIFIALRLLKSVHQDDWGASKN